MDEEKDLLLRESKPVTSVAKWRILCIVMYQNATYVVVLPFEVARLFPATPARTLGFLVAGSFSLSIVTPFFGYKSDTCTSKWGRRRPFILGGAAVMVCFTILMWIASIYSLGWLYAASLMMMQLGTVISTTAFSSLIPDIVPEHQRGFSSGVFGITAILGSALGYVLTGVALPITSSKLSYPIMAGVTALSCAVTLIFSKEQQQENVKNEPLTMKLFFKKTLGGMKHRNFLLVCVARAFFFMSLSPQAFLLYLVDDLTNSKRPTVDVTILAVSSQIAGLITTVPSDRFGRKIFVYCCTVIFVATYELSVLVHDIRIVYVLGALYGAGTGCYFAVDYALAIDCLPNVESENYSDVITSINEENSAPKSEAGANMGVWGISQSIGQLIGLYISGPLLQAVGQTAQKDHYTKMGYVAIFTLGAVYAVLAALFVLAIRLPKKREKEIK